MTRKELRGVIPALITPMRKDGSIDYDAMEANVAFLSRSGVHGFFVNGTTSEGPILSRAEKHETVRIVKSVSEGRQTICAACIAPSANLAIEEIRDIAALEPDYVVCVAPFYYQVPQEAIVDHFTRICASTDIPVIFYDIPQHTRNPIEVPTRFALINAGLGVAMKDSSGDFSGFSRSLLGCERKDFVWIQGDDMLDSYSMAIGARGIVSGLANVAPKPFIELVECAERGDLTGLFRIQEKINALAEILPAVGGRVIPAIKAAVSYLGRCEPWLRHTALTASESETAALVKIVDGLHSLI